MKYLKFFENHSDYETYINGLDAILPNVSYCEDQNDVHYNPLVIAQPLIVTYNVEDASNPTFLFIGAESIGFPALSIYDKIEIDDAEIDMSNLLSLEQEGMTMYGYTFERDGQHIVKYTLKDPTMIGAEVDEETDMPSKLGATFMTCPITSVEIPSSVTSIGGSAFGDCTGLTSITIPNTVTSIGFIAFHDCHSLTSVTLGSSVTSIGNEAFQSCTGLTSITIPNSVTSIGNNAFAYCSGLTSVTIEATTPPTIGSGVFASLRNYTIWVPASTANIYKAASGWSEYASRIHEVGEILF